MLVDSVVAIPSDGRSIRIFGSPFLNLFIWRDSTMVAKEEILCQS